MTIQEQKEHNHIVFLGENGFPIGLAAMQRMTLMAKTLLEAGFTVTVLCRKGVFRDDRHRAIPTEGSFQGIDYIYTSKSSMRPKGFFNRNLRKLTGIYGELKYLREQKKAGKLTAGLISNHSAFHLLRYKVFSVLVGFPIVLNFVELASSMKGREAVITKFNDRLFDNYCIRLVDGALPISEVLKEYYLKRSGGKPSMKLPIICDFDKFNTAVIPREEVQFLYCGAASYLELVAFIIKAYEHLKGFDRISLKLVLGGNPAQLREVKEVIDASSAKETITLVANVPHDDIPEFYASASALLIPLRPTVQDAARFPHKIGEYLASGRPMITTAYGEINHYRFKDGDTALIAEDYHPESFSHKMKFIIENPEQAYKIGLNGRRMGKASFHFPVFARDLKHYFEALNNTEAAIQSIKN